MSGGNDRRKRPLEAAAAYALALTALIYGGCAFGARVVYSSSFFDDFHRLNRWIDAAYDQIVAHPIPFILAASVINLATRVPQCAWLWIFRTVTKPFFIRFHLPQQGTDEAPPPQDEGASSNSADDPVDPSQQTEQRRSTRSPGPGSQTDRLRPSRRRTIEFHLDLFIRYS